jgi:threonine dehydrogenase-like Zn-dependent dehydrogenase
VLRAIVLINAPLFACSGMLGGVPGSQAEFVRVPFADVNAYPVPDDVPDDKALYMSDVLCTSLHSVVLGEVNEGSTVAIWGLGPIGPCAARWCQINGAKKFIGIDKVKDRLALAVDVRHRGHRLQQGQECAGKGALAPAGRILGGTHACRWVL